MLPAWTIRTTDHHGPNIWREVAKKADTEHSSSAQWQDQRQWAQTETWDVPCEHQETLLFSCEGDWTLSQVVQRGCRVSILGGYSKAIWILFWAIYSRCPAWAGVVNLMTFRGACQSQSFSSSAVSTGTSENLSCNIHLARSRKENPTLILNAREWFFFHSFY